MRNSHNPVVLNDDEQSARTEIERKIGDWDTAYLEGNAHGIVGHYLPDDAQYADCYNKWAAVMPWHERATAQSTVKEFQLQDGQAILVVEQNSIFCFLRPLPEHAVAGRVLLGLLGRFVFAEREVSRQVWISTREGWLCQSRQRISYSVRVRRRSN